MRVACYLRVSTSEQGQPGHVSLPVQRRATEEYAARQGWTVVKIYEDRLSGLDPTRPKYQELLAAAQRGEFDVVLVHDPTRFGRDTLEALTACRQLEQAGVTVQSVTTDLSSPFVRTLLFAQGEEESRAKSQRVQAALRRIASDGRWVGRAPTGYDLVREKGLPGGKLVPNRSGRAIARMFKRYAAGGVSIRALGPLAATWGLVGRDGRPLARAVINRLLQNRVYCGDLLWSRTATSRFTGGSRKRDPDEVIVVENAHPALVDRATFEAVQERLAFNRAHHSTARKTNYLATSFIWCGRCSARMQGYSPPRSQPVYRCMARAEYDACPLRPVPTKVVDEVVRCHLERLLPDPNPPGAREAFIANVMEALGAGGQRDLKRLRRERDRHRRRLRSLLEDRLEADVPEDIWRETVADERAALEAVEAEIAARAESDEAGITPEAISVLWDWMSGLEWPPSGEHLQPWRTLLEAHVERIEVHAPDDVRVRLNPASRAMAESQKGRPRYR